MMETLRARTVIDDDRRLVAVVESLAIGREEGGDVHGLFVRLSPVAVVVHAVDGTLAFDMNAEPANLDQLLNDVEDLRALLRQ